MKQIAILLFTISFAQAVFCQDLIITEKNDSINCKITKKNNDFIYFTFKHKDEIRNTLLPKSTIIEYQKDYFAESEVPDDKIKRKTNYPRFRCAIQTGPGYELGRLSDETPKDFIPYYRRVKFGITYGGSLSYYISEIIGLSLKYTNFYSYDKLDNIYATYEDGTTRHGVLRDRLNISFTGAGISTRFLNPKSYDAFFINYYLGYMTYNNDKIMLDPFTLKGNTLGWIIELGYDKALSKKVSIGVDLTYVMGTLMQYQIDKGNGPTTIKLKQGQFESLNRLDLSIGLRLNL